MGEDSEPRGVASGGSSLLAVAPGEGARGTLWSHLRMYGSGCMAYASLQSDFRYFVTSEGYIAYHCYRHPLLARRPVYIVVGDPVAPVSSFARLIRDFLGTAPHALFIHTSEDCAGVLDSQGLTVNQHGVETDLHLPHYDLRGKLKANLRHWVNTARKAGVEVIEQDLLSVDVKEVSEVSEEFLRRKGGRELALLTRPFEYREQPDVRFFWARRNGELLGFATFDPLYKNGRVYGYYRDITRCKHSAPNGTPDLITTTAIEQFKREGREVLKLGFSPLCLLADEPFHASRLLRWLFEYGYKYGELSYGFKGLAFHKKYYRGTERPVFVASTTRNNLLLIRDHTAYGHSLGMWAINRSRYFFSRLFSVRLRH